jgi:hypothetical protein
LIDHKISQCWKNTSLFSLALLAKFFFAAKPLAFWYWYKTDFKAATSTLLGHSLAQAQLTTQNVIQFLMIEFIVFSEWVKYSRNALARARVVSFHLASLDNLDTYFHQLRAVSCNLRTIAFSAALKIPMLSENLEWNFGFFSARFKTEIFIHFKALTILPIFITELGSKASLIRFSNS